MTIEFDVPPEIENALRREGRDPSEALKEAALVELYRRGAVGHHELGIALGLSRIQTDDLLKKHDVPLNISVEELRADLRTLHRISAR